MSLSALPIALLVPPISLLPTCLAGMLIARRRPAPGLALAAASLAGLLLLATPLVADWLTLSLERDLPLTPPPGHPPQAIVILSAEWARDAPGPAPGPAPALAPGPLTLERERAGAALARKTGLPILVTGGITGGLAGAPGDSLAAIMARSLAEDFATPARWTEQQSADTWENAAFSAKLLQADHIQSIYLVTHAWHMRRALLAFAPTGLVVTAAPVRLDQPAAAIAADLIPRTSAWLASYYALHEWIGCAAYALLR